MQQSETVIKDVIKLKLFSGAENKKNCEPTIDGKKYTNN